MNFSLYNIPESELQVPSFLATVVSLCPAIILWRDGSSFASAIEKYLIFSTSILQYSAIDFYKFRHVAGVAVFENVSSVSAVKLKNLNSKSRILLLTHDILTSESANILDDTIRNFSIRPLNVPEYLWINVHEGNETVFAYDRNVKKLVTIDRELAVDYLKETPRSRKVPNFRGENVIVAVGNGSIFAYLEKADNGSETVDFFDGYELRLLVEALEMMNLRITFRPIVWDLLPSIPEVKGLVPSILGDVLKHNSDIGSAGLFLRALDNLIESTVPWGPACVRYLVPRPKVLNASSQVFMKVFDPKLWWALAATILSISIVTTLLVKINKSRNDANYGNVLYSVLWTTMHFLQLYNPPRETYARSLFPLLLSWGLFGYMVTSIYSSELGARATKPFYTEKIQTERQFLSHSYYWWTGLTSNWDVLFDMSDPIVRKWTTEYYTSSMEERYEKIRQQKFVMMGFTKGRIFHFGADPVVPSELTDDYEVADTCALQKYIGIMFPTGSPFVDGVNLIFGRLISAGLYEKYEYEMVFGSPRLLAMIPKNVFTKTSDIFSNAEFLVLPISVLYGPLMFLLIGHVISFSVFCIFEIGAGKLLIKRKRRAANINVFRHRVQSFIYLD